jgi:hypothetical protein
LLKIKLALGCFNQDEKSWFQDREEDDRNVDDEIILQPAEKHSTFEDFEEMAIQFGYLSLFAPAFPMAPAPSLGFGPPETASGPQEYYLYEFKYCDIRIDIRNIAWALDNILEVLTREQTVRP